MASSLRITTWNANEAFQRKSEIELFLTIEHIDILLLSETNLTEKSVFHIPNYCVYLTARPDHKAHGCSAIILRNKYYKLSKLSNKEIQATRVRVYLLNGKIAISTIYYSQIINLINKN